MATHNSQLEQTAEFSIFIYRLNEEWFMDDPTKGIVMEPLVRGVPEIIAAIVGPRVDRFTAIFMADRIASNDSVLHRTKPEDGGHWYKLEGTTMNGWLCSVLLEYFDQAPHKLYLRIKK